MLIPRPNLRSENTPIVGCARLFNKSDVTLHIWKPSPPSSTRRLVMPYWQGSIQGFFSHSMNVGPFCTYRRPHPPTQFSLPILLLENLSYPRATRQVYGPNLENNFSRAGLHFAWFMGCYCAPYDNTKQYWSVIDFCMIIAFLCIPWIVHLIKIVHIQFVDFMIYLFYIVLT